MSLGILRLGAGVPVSCVIISHNKGLGHFKSKPTIGCTLMFIIGQPLKHLMQCAKKIW